MACIDRSNFYAYAGLGDGFFDEESGLFIPIDAVGGPGDEFFSVGPHGESSAMAQSKAHGPGESDTPIEGAVSNAVDQVVENMFDNQGQFQFGEEVAPGAGAPSVVANAAPDIASEPVVSSQGIASGTSKSSMALVLGVVAGALYFVFGK